MKLTLGFSPCPNDTFIFDALVNGKIDTKGISFSYEMHDVETLNQMAEREALDITKLSYGSYLRLSKPYALLHAGSALGKGVGPLLVSKKPILLEAIDKCSIAIPGAKTTANLLLSLAAPKAQNKTELVFNEIENAVLNNDYDLGLIIHESRFTYVQKGLHKVIDLGDWWEQSYKAAIPLGGIVMKRCIEKSVLAQVDALIKESVLYAWKHYPNLPEFVTHNAQEMNEQVMRQHIQLYVNEYTTNLGDIGLHSVNTLFQKAIDSHLINKSQVAENLFYETTS
ncbi:MAG: 1,4-dihydroxy-6-naphthoate synthase [Chitinophagaceae bacterium]|nr:1,4-dihydroxy-6-naphthoate synthase [Chitinophagaceae bacterium]